MKRLLVLAVAAVAALLIFAASSFALSGGPEACKVANEQGLELEGGRCVSVYQEFFYGYKFLEREGFPGGTGAVAECKYFDATLKLEGVEGGLMGIGANLGECVEYFKYFEENPEP